MLGQTLGKKLDRFTEARMGICSEGTVHERLLAGMAWHCSIYLIKYASQKLSRICLHAIMRDPASLSDLDPNFPTSLTPLKC